MNKSLEFVKKRFEEMGMNWDYKDGDVDVQSLESVCAEMFEGYPLLKETPSSLEIVYPLGVRKGDDIIKIEVVATLADTDFDDFDFYNSHGEYNDGTLFFTYQAIRKVFYDILSLHAYPKTKISSPDDLEGVQRIKITIGDAIIHQKEDVSPDPERLWMTNRLEVFIPAHFELIK